MIFSRSHSWHVILFFIVCYLIPKPANAQSALPTPSPTPRADAVSKLEHDFLKNILTDQKAIWTSPFRLHGDDARWLAPLGLGTAALIATDRNTADSIARFDDQLQTSRAISHAGSIYGAAGVGALFYFTGRARHDLRARETGLLSWEALIDSEIVVGSLKALTQRRRPLAPHDRGEFFEGGTSFPSGHAIQAWSVATVIAHEYSDHRLAQVAAYGLAAAVSFARYTGEKHFLSDVLVGSAMGYGIGRYVYKTHHVKRAAAGSDEEESFAPHRHWPAITPEYSRAARVYGVRLAWSF
jgi:membrane-associated phospholipid phosphatase